MEQNIPNVRFVHVISPEKGGQGRGLTVAYVRTEDYLAFAWADKRPGEPYVKALGRKYTTDRLADWLMHPEFGTLTAYSPIFVSQKDSIGVLHVDFLKQQFHNLDVLSNQYINQLTWMDTKHAAISRILRQILGAP